MLEVTDSSFHRILLTTFAHAALSPIDLITITHAHIVVLDRMLQLPKPAPATPTPHPPAPQDQAILHVLR